VATRHPWRVGVTDLLHRPGTQRPLLASEPLEGLAVAGAYVDDDVPVDLDVVLEAQGESVTVTGVVRASYSGECRRCLRAVEGTVETHVQEVFERHPVEGDTYPLVGDEVDLEPMVRDAVLLALPLAPLCSEGCAGPDPERHPVGEHDDQPRRDERWAALDQLRFDR
jgi:uncharacterized protein